MSKRSYTNKFESLLLGGRIRISSKCGLTPGKCIHFSLSIRAMGKELNKDQFDHVHIPFRNGQRWLPQVADHDPELPKPKSEPGEAKKEILTSMTLPQDEFGVRRLFRGDEGRYDWPMMSGTMTHVCPDCHLFANGIKMDNEPPLKFDSH